MIKKIAIVFCIIAISGCSGREKNANESLYVRDNCLRNKVFMECLKSVPKGPTHTVASNDWDEAIEACESAAYYQSLQLRNGRQTTECLLPAY